MASALHPPYDRIGELARADRRRIVPVRLQVVRHVLALGDHRRDGALELVGGVALGDVPQHEDARQHQRHRD